MSVKDEINGPYGETPDHWNEWDAVAAGAGFAGKSGARQHFDAAMKRVARRLLRELGQPVTEDSISTMASSRQFHLLVEDALLLNLADTINRRNQS